MDSDHDSTEGGNIITASPATLSMHMHTYIQTKQIEKRQESPGLEGRKRNQRNAETIERVKAEIEEIVASPRAERRRRRAVSAELLGALKDIENQDPHGQRPHQSSARCVPVTLAPPSSGHTASSIPPLPCANATPRPSQAAGRCKPTRAAQCQAKPASVTCPL
jgi:hypothetical protein